MENSKEESEDILVKKDRRNQATPRPYSAQAAEMENTRKRLERERSDGISFANESMIRGLLPVIDNLERAVQHGEKDTKCQRPARRGENDIEKLLGMF